ncbi:MAG: hypothetical protein LBF38_03410, partial [Deltaproteobacteria bacterium]|nr:hypothetical protein [Deltaproteobacteria bacterium]
MTLSAYNRTGGLSPESQTPQNQTTGEPIARAQSAQPPGLCRPGWPETFVEPFLKPLAQADGEALGLIW